MKKQDPKQSQLFQSQNLKSSKKRSVNLKLNVKISNDFEKSHLQKLIDTPLHQKTRQTLKNIKNQIRQMKCFKQLLEIRAKNQDKKLIIKENQILINMIAMYGQTGYYKKGTIVQACASRRQAIRILLRGKVGLFQPNGNRSYRNCHQKFDTNALKNNQLNMLVNKIHQKGQHFATSKLKSKQSIWLIEDNTLSIQQKQHSNNESSDLQNYYQIGSLTPVIQNKKTSQNLTFSLKQKSYWSQNKIQKRFGIKNTKDPQNQDNQSKIKNKQTQKQKQKQTDQHELLSEQINVEQLKLMLLKEQTISQNYALKLLNWTNISSDNSPHKFIKTLQILGYLISSPTNVSILNQPDKYESTMVCLDDCAFLEIQLSVFKQISNNDDKLYIRALLKKFEHLDYYQAKKYVNKFTMIDKQKNYKNQNYQKVMEQFYQDTQRLVEFEQQHIQELKQKTFQEFQLSSPQLNSPNIIRSTVKQKLNKQIVSQNGKFKIKTIKSYEISKQEQFALHQNENLQMLDSSCDSEYFKDNNQFKLSQVKDSLLLDDITNLTFDLPFQNQLYLIVAGQVTIKIDQVSAYRISQDNNAVLKKKVTPIKILKLYPNDLFGFEQLGSQNQYNLRYEVRMNSKILKLDQKLVEKHKEAIYGFSQQIKSIKNQRNVLVRQLVWKIQRNMQKKLLDKYLTQEIPTDKKVQKEKKITWKHNRIVSESLSDYQNCETVPEKGKEIRQIKFMGKKSFDQLQEKLISNLNIIRMPKNQHKITLDLLKQFTPSVNFFQQKKEVNGKITLNKYFQMRNKEGILLRRKSVPVQGSKQAIQNAVMKKIGVLNQKEMVKHNLNIVKNRKSTYKFQDIQKQKKQQRRLRQMSKSLPKLSNFYAKGHNLNFKCVHPGKILLF